MQKSNIIEMTQEHNSVEQKQTGMNRSNLMDVDQNSPKQGSETTAKKSELATIVDRQLEARGVVNCNFDEKEVKRTLDRELLGPKFYKGVLEECGLDFWMVLKYAMHYLYDESGALSKELQPASVKDLFTILTGEKFFVNAVQVFVMEVYPTHARDWVGITQVFSTCCRESGYWHPIKPIKEYFAFELTDEKLRKLEVLLENANAMKPERFKLGDQFAERQEGNMERIQRLMEVLGKDSKESVFTLLLNELRVNPSDIFRYFYHRDLCLSLIWGGSPGKDRGGNNIGGRLPLLKSENFETFLKITGMVSYNDIFSKYPDAAKHTNIFWKELQEALNVPLEGRDWDGSFFFPGVDSGYRGQGLWGDAYMATDWAQIHKDFYKGYWREDPMYLISSYGAEATKDRLDAIFTPEVLEIIYRDYKQFTFEPEKRNVENAMKQLRTASGTGEEKPVKKGLFGLFKR